MRFFLCSHLLFILCWAVNPLHPHYWCELQLQWRCRRHMQTCSRARLIWTLMSTEKKVALKRVVYRNEYPRKTRKSYCKKLFLMRVCFHSYWGALLLNLNKSWLTWDSFRWSPLSSNSCDFTFSAMCKSARQTEKEICRSHHFTLKLQKPQLRRIRFGQGRPPA